MKRYIVSILLIAGFIMSCSEKEFLQENPKDEIYASNLFNDLDGFEGALNALYALARQEFTEGIEENGTNIPIVRNAIWTIGVDNGYANGDFAASTPYNLYGTYLNSNDKLAYCAYRWLYREVNSANMVISRAENPAVNWKGKTIEENNANKNRVIAEAKFFRAWAYRHLTYTFGDVPLSLEEISGATYKNDWIRTPVADIRKVMEQDLLFAETNLPAVSSNPGKIVKAVAQHYLAELYLAVGKNDLAQAKALAVCSNTQYKLINARYGVNKAQPGSPFSDMFFDGNIMPAEGNTEVLWLFPNAPDVTGNEQIRMRRSWIYTGSISGVSPGYPTGGRGIGRCAITNWAFTIYGTTDTRYTQAIRWSYVKSNGTTVNLVPSTTPEKTKDYTRPNTRKWDWDFVEPTKWAQPDQWGDVMYLRLADTYLLLAEAEFKLGNLTQSANWINLLRTRAGATPALASEITLDYILDERSRELLAEENRRETLVRTGKLVERVRKYNKIAGLTIQETNILLPVPQAVIDANTGLTMPQNPGY